MENLPENVQEEPMPATEVAADEPTGMENHERDRELVKMISQDERVGHFIVDVLSGTDPQEAAGRYFPAGGTNAEAVTPTEVESLVAEAEQRGYVRGRNERIELEMHQPPMWNGDVPESNERESQPSILNNMRRSVWEK